MDDELERLSDRYLAELQAGGSPDSERYLEAHPHLAGALRRRLANLDLLHRASRELSSSGTAGGEGSGERSAPGLPAMVGRFEVLSALGRGTFGTVYKAKDPELGRAVAIKVPRAGAFISAEQEERFLREARSAARLKHPGIVAVYEIGQEGDIPFIVSQLVEGPTLAQRLTAAGRLPFREATQIVRRIAEALDAAHRQGIVHRDVKPGNILLDGAGEPLVSDFGLASRGDDDVTVTTDGQILGTPAYMSPEQAAGEGEKIDARSDVFSLGVVFYELLTGERPFRGSKSMVVWQVIHEEPRPPRTLNDDVPRDLETICLKAMAKDPARRYAAAGELGEDLGRFLRGEPILARPVGPAERLWRWARRNPAIASLAASLALTLVSAVVVLSIAIARTLLALDEAHLRYQRLNLNTGVHRMDQGDLAASLHWHVEALRLDQGEPDLERVHRRRFGSTLAHCARLLYVRAQDRESIFSFSPDGRLIAFGHPDGLVLRDAATGEPKVKLRVGTGPRFARSFSPDSQLMATVGQAPYAVLWDTATGNEVRRLEHGAVVAEVEFSPDGSRIITASNDRTAAIWDRSTGERLLTLQHESPVRRVGFNPAGGTALTIEEAREVRLWDAAEGTVRWRHENATGFAFSPGGDRVGLVLADGKARVVDAATGKLALPVLEQERPIALLFFSPDGKRLGTIAREALCIWNARSGLPAFPPLYHLSLIYHATFSPDGRYVWIATEDGMVRRYDAWSGAEAGPSIRHANAVVQAFVLPAGHLILTRSDNGVFRLWDITRAQPSLPLLRHELDIADAAISPDGRTLATASSGGTVGLWDAATGEPAAEPLVHGQPVSGLAFSPDGSRLATVKGYQTLSLWDCATWRRVAEHPLRGRFTSRIVFSPAGGLLACGALEGLQLYDAKTGRLHGPLLDPGGSVRDGDFSPDGRRILVAGLQEAAVYETATGRLVYKVPFGGGRNGAVRVSPDGTTMLLVKDRGPAGLWSADGSRGIAGPIQLAGGATRQADFSRDGMHVLLTSYDGTARVYNARTGRPESRVLPQTSAVAAAAFSADGSQLATGSIEGVVRVWDWRTGEELCPALRHQRRVVKTLFGRDGLTLFTAGQDGLGKVWDLRSDDRPREDLALLARLLTGRQLDEEGNLGSTVSLEELREADAKLRARYPEEFAVSPDDLRLWHSREAEAAEAANEPFAAIWHLERQRALRPDDERLGRRLAAARAALSRQASAVVRGPQGDPRDPRLARASASTLVFHGRSNSEISQLMKDQKMWMVDIEVERASPMRFSGVLMSGFPNQFGGWWWYFDQTPEAIDRNLSQNGGRLLDLEPYESQGKLRFAAVMIPATPEERSRHHWRHDLSESELRELLEKESTWRVTDLDAYPRNGGTRFSVVAMAAATEEEMPAWTYVGLTAEELDRKIAERGAQLYDLEAYESEGRQLFGAVLIPREDWASDRFSWRSGLTLAELEALLQADGPRAIDLEIQRAPGSPDRFAVLMARPLAR